MTSEKRRRIHSLLKALHPLMAAVGLLVGVCAFAASPVKRVIIISADGMHSIDFARFVKANPQSHLAELARRGITYTQARQPVLGDSSPGLLSIMTGGSPYSTGILYSPTYDRSLSPKGSDCSTLGTVVYIDEKAAFDFKREDSGGGINPEMLPRDPGRNCAPVYPWQLQRVNNIFEVVKQSGGRTAWIDQHLMYSDMLRGPSGKGLDDEFVLEANTFRKTIELATGQDGRRMDALIHQIRGFDSRGGKRVGVPRLFGMGFISLGVAQKIEGYADGSATPKALIEQSLRSIDSDIGRMLSELRKEKLYDSTMIVLSSKHGQSPIDSQQRKLVDRKVIRDAVNSVEPGLLAQASLDSIGLIWLKDSSKIPQVLSALRSKFTEAAIHKIYAGEDLALILDPKDPRTPDIIIQPMPGAFYVENVDSPASQALLAEHGGMLDEDVHVPLVVSVPGAQSKKVLSPVLTSQIAPTVLKSLGLNPQALKAVRIENTPLLPGF